MRQLFCLFVALPLVAFVQPGDPSAADRDRVLKTVKEFAGGYLQHLPDFVCVRTTQHLMRESPDGAWKPEVKVSNELSYYSHQEHYRIVAVNDAPAKKMPRLHNWVYSNGDFGDFLSNVFGEKSPATFDWKGWDTVRGKRAWTFTYKMPGGYMITGCGSVLFVGGCKSHVYPFHGEISIAEDGLSILRFVVAPDNVPQNQESRTIDYDQVSIGGAPYLLPIADTFERMQGKTYFRNESVYRDYRKFSADSSIKVAPDQER
jgi:hypothetical protein